MDRRTHMARSQHTEHRRQPAPRSRVRSALARVALDGLAVEAALRSLELTKDSPEAELVRRIGPGSAAAELVKALVERDPTYDLRTGLTARLDERSRRDRPPERPASEASFRVEVDPVWKDLGHRFGFLPVLDDLAVIVNDDARSESHGDLLRHVAEIVARLDREGREHSAIALAATGLPDDVEDAIFDAGAQLVVVEPEFLDLDDAGRIARLRVMLDDMPDALTAAEAPERRADHGLYDGPNPSLTATELADWERRFEQSDETD